MQKLEATVINEGEYIDIIINDGLSSRFTKDASVFRLHYELSKLSEIGYKIKYIIK